MKVFWSWQSDVAAKECRTFIRAALVEAIQKAGQELELTDAERPEIDHDTKGAPGMADIADEILKKIAASAVFVADVTPISRVGKKAIPNPNVLVELGFAMANPGFDRIIAVLNTAGGGRVEDLPFDIRKRRVMTYELASDATPAERAKQKKELVAALTDALKVNLQSHLTQTAAGVQIVGSPSKVDDASIWASSTGNVDCNDGSLSLRTPKAIIPLRPRAYMRVIPAGWKNGRPTVDDIANVPDGEAVWPATEGLSSGSFGPCPEGYVRYWLTGKRADGTFESENLSLYLDDFGEYWILHGTAIAEDGNGKKHIFPQHLLRTWSNSLRRVTAIFDRFKADPVRKVELGVVGLDRVHWHAGTRSIGPPSRKPSFTFARQQRDWSLDARFSVLQAANDELRNVFALPKMSPEHLRAVLDQFDAGWNKQ